VSASHGQPGLGQRDGVGGATRRQQRLRRAHGRRRPRPLVDPAVVHQPACSGERRLRATVRSREPGPLRGELVAEPVVAHAALGIPQHGIRVVGPVERPEQVACSRDGDRRELLVIGDPGRQVGEHALGLRAMPARRERAPERQLGVEAGVRLDRRPREALRQDGVHRPQCVERSARQQRAVGRRAGLQPPGGEAQQVASPACATRLQRVGEPCVDRLQPRGREARPHGLAVERMDDVDDAPPPIRAALHELVRLQRLQGLPCAEQLRLHGPGDRHELQRVTRARSGLLDAQVDELREARRSLDLAAPAPDAAVVGQQPAVDPVAGQLAQEERVAARHLPQRGDGAAVNRPAQAGDEEPLDVAARQLVQLQHRAVLVLPQRPEGIRHRLPRPHGHDRDGLAGGHELVHERRGRVVERVPVVDAEHQAGAGGPLGQRVTRSGQELDALPRADGGGRQHGSEGPQRDGRRRSRRANPFDRAAPGGDELGGLDGQPRLADTGGTGDDDAARAGVRQGLRDDAHLGFAPLQRPPHAQSVIGPANE
jgi:hypothetical protein